MNKVKIDFNKPITLHKCIEMAVPVNEIYFVMRDSYAKGFAKNLISYYNTLACRQYAIYVDDYGCFEGRQYIVNVPKVYYYNIYKNIDDSNKSIPKISFGKIWLDEKDAESNNTELGEYFWVYIKTERVEVI